MTEEKEKKEKVKKERKDDEAKEIEFFQTHPIGQKFQEAGPERCGSDNITGGGVERI